MNSAPYRRFVGRFFRAVGLRKRDAALPRVVTMRAFISRGCLFEITTPIEAFRVERFGGEKRFTRLILAELQPGDVRYDIGACVGLVAVHAALKGVQVVAFEPDPGYRGRLKANLCLNKLDKVRVVEWAVADTQGEATLFTDGVDGISPSLREMSRRGTLKVQMNTIDNALENEEIPRPDVVKLDIEGAEILALRGMRRLLGAHRSPRTIFIEIHPDFLRAFGSTTERVVEFLESFRYRLDYQKARSGQIHCIYRR